MKQFQNEAINQLDFVLDQLQFNERNYDRFAFMLVDNIVELTFYKLAQLKYDDFNYINKGQQTGSSIKNIEKALYNQFFIDKIKFAESEKIITNEIAESLKYLHLFRNKVYHAGSGYEIILHSMAINYFIIACSILKNFPRREFDIQSTTFEVSYRSKKYLEKDSLYYAKSYSNAFQRLKDIGSSMKQNLVEDLTLDMAQKIRMIDDDIHFIAETISDDYNRDKAVIFGQAWPFSNSQKAIDFAINNNCEVIGEDEFLEWLTINYQWRVSKDPVFELKKRFERIKTEKRSHKALEIYSKFIIDTEELITTIHEAAIHLDWLIDREIDRKRGK